MHPAAHIAQRHRGRHPRVLAVPAVPLALVAGALSLTARAPDLTLDYFSGHRPILLCGFSLVLHGVGLPARGLYPPSLPGYDAGLAGQTFDPTAARRMLARSRYKTARALPPTVLTTSGFGSYEAPGVAALAAMWQRTLGVSIRIENVEPDRYVDELHAGRHGGLFFDGWCADYPDPENFADALFHSGAQANLGHYSNRALDVLLERARVEPDVTARLRMYDRVQRAIVGDAAAIFLAHGESLALVKPYIRGYVFTPLSVPIVHYLSLRPH